MCMAGSKPSTRSASAFPNTARAEGFRSAPRLSSRTARRRAPRRPFPARRPCAGGTSRSICGWTPTPESAGVLVARRASRVASDAADSILQRDRWGYAGGEVTGQRDDQHGCERHEREARERDERAEGVDDGESDHVGQRAIEQLLAVETEDRAARAADAEQQDALQHDRAPQLGGGKALELEIGRAN